MLPLVVYLGQESIHDVMQGTSETLWKHERHREVLMKEGTQGLHLKVQMMCTCAVLG